MDDGFCVACDCCGVTTAGYGDAREALLAARDAGWRIGGPGEGDYCPACVAEAAAIGGEELIIPRGAVA